MQNKTTKAKKLTTKAQRPEGELLDKMHKPLLGSLFFSGFGFLLVLVSWCLGGPSVRVHADSAPNFTSQVAPILQKNCLACHSSASKMGGLVMENYGALMKGGAHGAAIIPGKADQSRMIQMLSGKVQPRMPFGADP